MTRMMLNVAEEEEYQVEVLSDGDPCSVKVVAAVDSAEFDEGQRIHNVRRTDDGLKKFK